MTTYRCTVCTYIYDEAVMGIPFDDLDDEWVCPKCGASKMVFEPSGRQDADEPTA